MASTPETDTDYLVELFGSPDGVGESARLAGLERLQAQAKQERAARLATEQAIAEESRRYRCPRCAGTGHIPHFQHHKAGECFACGGTGKRTQGA